MKDRALALAGLLQAVHLVQQMAQTGQAEARPLGACIDSLFRFDAETPEAVFDGADKLDVGLARLVNQLEGGSGRDAAVTRMAMTVLHLERRFSGNRGAMDAVHTGLQDIARQRDHWGPTHPTVLARLGELYAKELSPIGPRVLVQGNPVYWASPTWWAKCVRRCWQQSARPYCGASSAAATGISCSDAAPWCRLRANGRKKPAARPWSGRRKRTGGYGFGHNAGLTRRLCAPLPALSPIQPGACP
nr:DUF489 family protein [Arenimonas daejeonensis]